MKKLPLITLLSFSILIPTITLADNKDGYEYKLATTIASNNYYFFDEPSKNKDNFDENINNGSTINYTLFTNFENDWYKATIKEITLDNDCKEEQFNGSENCWTYARFYYIADQISSMGKVVETSKGSGIYSRDLYGKNGLNIYHGHSGYKNDLAKSDWELATKSNECPDCTGEWADENIKNIDKYWKKICSSITTGNKVSLIYDVNGKEEPITKNDILNSNTPTIVKIQRTYKDKEFVVPNTIDWNNKMQLSTNNTTTSCKDGKTYPMDDGVHSVVLINAQATSTEKQCVEIKKTSSAKCNESAKMENVKCLKTITKGKNRRDVKLDQTATLTNILTPTKIYQGGGIKLGFMYYNTVEWSFSEDEAEKYGDDDSEIRGLLESKLKSPDELANDIVVEVSLKNENGVEIGKIDNIQKSCEQTGKFKEGETVTTTCTFLLPESIVDLGTGKVTYKNSPGQGINNEYYTPITYTGELSLYVEISNIGVLDVDNWTKNWKLTYDDNSCKVNVTSRLYKPDQSNKYAFIYRPIDINNPFPNRNAGVNWYDWYSIPANKERLKSSYSKEEYQVILDNQSVSKIKEYNKNNNNYLDWKGINEETEKSDFINNYFKDNYKIERIQEGGNP